MPVSGFTRQSTVFNNGQAIETPRGLLEVGLDLSLSPGNRSTRQEEKVHRGPRSQMQGSRQCHGR